MINYILTNANQIWEYMHTWQYAVEVAFAALLVPQVIYEIRKGIKELKDRKH